MVKGYDPVGGKYEFIPSPKTEDGQKYFLSQAAWSFDELCSLICEVDLNWESDPVARVAWANGEDTIKKGIASAGLKPLTVMGELYFLPQETVLWASRTLKDFPFKPNDMTPDTPREVIQEYIGTRKADNLHKIIGILALELGCKRSGGHERSALALFQDSKQLMDTLEKAGIQLDKYGLGQSSFLEAIKQGISNLPAK